MSWYSVNCEPVERTETNYWQTSRAFKFPFWVYISIFVFFMSTVWLVLTRLATLRAEVGFLLTDRNRNNEVTLIAVLPLFVSPLFCLACLTVNSVSLAPRGLTQSLHPERCSSLAPWVVQWDNSGSLLILEYNSFVQITSILLCVQVIFLCLFNN